MGLWMSKVGVGYLMTGFGLEESRGYGIGGQQGGKEEAGGTPADYYHRIVAYVGRVWKSRYM